MNYFVFRVYTSLTWFEQYPKEYLKEWRQGRKSSMFHICFPSESRYLLFLDAEEKHQQENYTKNLWSWVFVIQKLNFEMFALSGVRCTVAKPSETTLMKISQKQSRSNFHFPHSFRCWANTTQHNTLQQNYNGYSTVYKVTKSRVPSIFRKWSTLKTFRYRSISFHLLTKLEAALYNKGLSLNN